MSLIRCGLVPLLTIFLMGMSASGTIPTDQKLRITESEHFTYIYQESLKPLIPALARDCEDAYRLLTPIFHWTPREKVIVLFADSTDIHNGWATVFPRPTMMIHAADSPPGSTIYEPGNYLRRTVFHEFTHLLSMDPQFGVDRALSRFFGRVWPVLGDPLSTLISLCALPPGAVAPTWFIEGLAMWSETEMVGPGRGRNALVDMILRMSVEDNRLLPPSRWDLDHPEWPYGEAAYLYGLKTIQYAQDAHGRGEPERNVAGDLSLVVADSFMFNFNGQALPVTGERFHALAWQVIATETALQRERIDRLKQRPLTPVERLTPQRLNVAQPRFGPDGRHIYFSGGEEADRTSLYRHDIRTGRHQKIARARTSDGLTRLAPAADRSLIYYTRLNTTRRERFYFELHRYSTHHERSRLITRHGRYKFIAVSPDGQYIAAVRDTAGQQSIIEIPAIAAGIDEEDRVLLQAEPRTTLVDPVYSPDGRFIVFVEATEKSSRLLRLDRASGDVRSIVDWECLITSPTFHPSGRELVFVSDRNGVYNLYRIPFRPRSPPEALTHVLGGLFEPDFSPDGKRLAAVGYDSYGYYLTILDYGNLTPIAASDLPALTPEWHNVQINAARKESVEQEAQEPFLHKSMPYYSPGHIRMDFWSPWLTASEDGVMGGLVASFSDPVEYNRLLIIGGHESEHDTPLASLVYSFSGYEPILTLYGAHLQNHYESIVEDDEAVFYDYDEETGSLGAAVSMPFQRIDLSLTLTLGYQWTQRKAIHDSVKDFDEATLVTDRPFEGEESAFWGRMEFFNATAFPRSHSLEDGRYVAVTVERSDSAWGGELSRTRALGEWLEYIPLPWSENHVLKLQAYYGEGSGDETTQGFFGLGGYDDLLSSSSPGLTDRLSLRGYESNTQVGDRIVKAGAAWRFPLARFYRGADATTPLYFHQLFGELYYEGGQAAGGEPAGRPKNEWLNAYGVEISLATKVLRFVEVAPGLGVVYAADREERNHRDDDEDNDKLQVYVSIKSKVNF